MVYNSNDRLLHKNKHHLQHLSAQRTFHHINMSMLPDPQHHKYCKAGPAERTYVELTMKLEVHTYRIHTTAHTLKSSSMGVSVHLAIPA